MMNMKDNISKLTQKTTGRVIQSVLLLIHDYANYVQKVRRQSNKKKSIKQRHAYKQSFNQKAREAGIAKYVHFMKTHDI